MASCRIIRNTKGDLLSVESDSGKASKLYADILAVPELKGDKELALRLYEKIHTEEFTNRVKVWIDKDGIMVQDTLDENGEYKLSWLLKHTTLFVPQREALRKDMYSAQMSGKTKTAKDVAEKLLLLQDKLQSPPEDGEFYSYEGKQLKRVTSVLKEDPYFGYFGDSSSDQFELSRQWGNIVDSILSSVILGQPVVLEDNALIDPKVVDYLTKVFSDLRAKYPNHIFLTQTGLFNLSKGVAGTADIVMISPEGKLTIVDLKTSKYPFTGAYKSDAGFTTSYRAKPKREGKETASRMERHAAQVSTYAAMSQAMGFELDENPVRILPFQIDGVVDDTITHVKYDTYWKEGEQQDFIDLPYMKVIHDAYVKDTMIADTAGAITRALKTLKEHALLAQKSGKRLASIEALIKEIESSVDIEAATKFINNAYTTFVERIAKEYKDQASLAKKGELSAVDFMDYLDTVRQVMDIYHGKNSILKDINRLYRDVKSVDPGYRPEAGSTLDKLDITMRVIDDIRMDIDTSVPTIIATILAKQMHTGSIEAIKAKIAAIQKRINSLPADSRVRANLVKELEVLNEKWRIDESGNPDTVAMLEQEIRQGGYKDISAVDRWLTPAVSMDNSFLATFVLTLKEAFEKAKMLARDFMYQAHKEFEKYAAASGGNRDNSNSFNAGLYKTRRIYLSKDNPKEVLSFVAPIDYGAFEEARHKMYEQAEKIEDNNARNKFVSDWYEANTQIRPMEHTEGVTMFNGVKLLDTVKDVAMGLRERHGVEHAKKHMDDNIVFEGKGIKSANWKSGMLMPKLSKYSDPQWASLMANKAKKDYYLFLMSSYLKSQSRMPQRKSESHRFIAPFVKKSSNDRLREGKFWNAFKDQVWDEAMFRLDEDFQTEGLEETKTIPILFYNDAHAIPAADVSTDLMASILKFEIASLRYEQQAKHASLADNLLQSAKQGSPAATDTAGFKILSKAAKAVGITDGIEKYVKKHGTNNVVAMLEAFIDVTIYGQRRKDPTFKVGKRTVDIGKVADTIIGFSSKTQIAADWTLALANSLQARVNAQIEAAARQIFTPGEWISAGNEYTRLIPQMMKDRLNPVSTSLIGQLIDLYDPMQGNFHDEFGHRLTKSALKTRMNTSMMYFMMRQGEHHVQVTSLIAMLKNKKVKQDDKEISLYDAYELKDGKLSLKDRVELEGLVDTGLQNRLHAVNKRLHGVYNNFDKVELERYWYGRLLLMYKKWLGPGLKRRWKSEGFDYELGDFTEGMYNTTFKKLFTEFGEFAKFVTGREHTFTPMEIANIRRTLYEFSIIAITGTLAIILTALGSGADTDKKWKYQWPLYFAMRLNAELSVFGGLGDPSSLFLPNLREVLSPYKSIPAMSVLTKVTNLYSSASADVINTLAGGEITRYERDTGVFEKGTSKTAANLVKVFGISGKSLDSDLALDILLLQKGSTVSIVGKTRD